ncbi:hypothetical protein KGO5_03071 [Sinorhizobium sp. KGO-5]|uniref:hypothetical protein n=1 Tax=Sinorhizobium sp. KGO-5 TaxID=1470810 RepID=UPI00294A3A55|nr:hypothetical protein [Sinorhizobium medicae]GCA50624.1 hypothetical protein KGO5_03071 [Sinorhizobium sp. KGO-5]
MASEFLEYAANYELKTSDEINAFVTALVKQKEAFANSEFNNRSWVKKDGAGYLVKLGKLEKTYRLPDKADVEIFLDKAADAARGNDVEFRELIEAAYKKASQPKAKR